MASLSPAMGRRAAYLGYAGRSSAEDARAEPALKPAQQLLRNVGAEDAHPDRLRQVLAEGRDRLLDLAHRVADPIRDRLARALGHVRGLDRSTAEPVGATK